VSTPWVRLFLTVEGPTEQAFAKETLAQHLAGFSIVVIPLVVVTNRKLDARGGIFDFAHLKNDLGRSMRQHAGDTARFTTMIDLYALPNEFPGWHAAQSKPPVEKVALLERALEVEISDRRFVPHIQLHEFETLLFCDLGELQRRLADSDQGIAKLAAEVEGLSPEDINDGATTAPSNESSGMSLRTSAQRSRWEPRQHRPSGCRCCAASARISRLGSLDWKRSGRQSSFRPCREAAI
jgi:hypothetical protein